MPKETYPELAVALWRSFRTAIAALVATAALETWNVFVNNLDWSKFDLTQPEKFLKAAAVSLAAGFLTFLGKAIRDKWGKPDKSGAIDKLII